MNRHNNLLRFALISLLPVMVAGITGWFACLCWYYENGTLIFLTLIFFILTCAGSFGCMAILAPQAAKGEPATESDLRNGTYTVRVTPHNLVHVEDKEGNIGSVWIDTNFLPSFRVKDGRAEKLTLNAPILVAPPQPTQAPATVLP